MKKWFCSLFREKSLNKICHTLSHSSPFFSKSRKNNNEEIKIHMLLLHCKKPTYVDWAVQNVNLNVIIFINLYLQWKLINTETLANFFVVVYIHLFVHSVFCWFVHTWVPKSVLRNLSTGKKSIFFNRRVLPS